MDAAYHAYQILKWFERNPRMKGHIFRLPKESQQEVINHLVLRGYQICPCEYTDTKYCFFKRRKKSTEFFCVYTPI